MRKFRKPHHGHGGTHHVGRSRIALAKLLNRVFPEWDVQPEDIKPATGRSRTDWRMDIYRWELFTRTKTGLPVVLACWETIGDFLKGCRPSGTCHVAHGELSSGPAPKT